MKDYPVIKFTLLFIFGIIVQHQCNIDATIIYYFIISLLLLAILFLFKRSNSIFNQLIIASSIILLGMCIAVINSDETPELPRKIFDNKTSEIYGKIKEINLIQTDQIKFEVLTDSIIGENASIYYPYVLLCRLKVQKGSLNKFYRTINPGYKLKIKSKIYETRDRRNPGEFDYKKYLLSVGISGNINLSKINQIEITEKDKDFLQTLIFSIRKNIAEQIDQLYSYKTSSLLKGLLLADRSNISYTTKEEFINAGVIHVLAVSGLHVGFIALIVIIILGRINLFVRSILTIFALLLFLLITGSPSSVLRAVIMGSVIIISFVLGRSTNIFNSLSIAALIILAFSPKQLFAPGFQLSFSAVWGIAVFFPLCKEYLTKINIENKILKNILLFLSVSLGAQIGTLPFTLIYFGKLSIIALLINLIVIPLVGFIIATGIISLVINIIFPFIAVFYSAANELFANLLFSLISKAGNLSFSFIKISNFNYYDALIVFISLFFFLLVRKKLKRSFAKFIVVILLIINIFLFTSFTNKEILPKDELSILMVDVGQGDAIIVKYPDGKISLIDAGIRTNSFDTGKYILEPLLNYLNIDKIDLAFLSHMDIDHYGGFNYLINKGIIKEIYKPLIDSSLAKDIRFEKLLDINNITKKYYEQKIIKEDNVRIYILNSNNNKAYNRLSTNNKSGMIKIVYGENSVLLTGDIEKKGELFYSKYYKDFLRSDILKVAHHGSKTSSTEGILNYIKPKIGLISVGKYNSYGHPSKIIIERYKNNNVKIYRTDLQSAILFQSDGKIFKYEDWRE